MKGPFKHIDLGDKFSEFEHSPDNSNWNSIHGGLNSKHVPGKLSEKFEGFSETPSAVVWKEVSAVQHPSRKRRAVAYWWNSGVAASLVGVLMVSVLWNNETNEWSSQYSPRSNSGSSYAALVHDELSVNDIEKLIYDEERNSTSKEFGNENLSNEKSKLARQEANYRNSLLVNNAASQVDNHLNHNVAEYLEEESYSEIAAELNERDTLITFHVASNDLTPVFKYDYSLLDYQMELAGEKQFLSSDFPDPRIDDDQSSYSLLASNQITPVQGANTASSSPSINVGVGSFNTLTSTPTEESFVYLDVAGDLTIVRSNENFSLPIYFSINGEKQLKKMERVHVGLGVGALFMNSDWDFEFEEFYSKTTLLRKYLVIPVYGKYDVLQKQKFSIYTSLGVTSELGLGGVAKTKDYESGELVNSTTSKLNVGLGQFNANLGVGTTVKLTKYLSLFGEVSAAHYFQSSQPNLWSQKQIWESAKTGVVFKF